MYMNDLKPCCRYSWWTCLIKYSMLFIFLFLIILTVANIMCQDMVFRNLIPFMCMRSQHTVTLLYLSRMPLGTLGIMIGSTCWILWRTVLPWKYGLLSPQMSSEIPTFSRKIGIFYRMLLSTECRIRFTSWLEMCWNCLARSSLFT